MEPVSIVTTPVKNIEAPKTVEHLEEISNQRWQQRKIEESDDDDDDDNYTERIQILDNVNSNDKNIDLGIEEIKEEKDKVVIKNNDLLDDLIEELL